MIEIKPGDLISIESVIKSAQVIDVARGEQHTMLLVRSPKSIALGQRDEWLELSDMMQTFDWDKAQRDLRYWREVLQKRLAALDELEQCWRGVSRKNALPSPA